MQISTKADGLKLPFLSISDYLARSNKFLITNFTIGDYINFCFFINELYAFLYKLFAI
jgi:hypothetical protein